MSKQELSRHFPFGLTTQWSPIKQQDLHSVRMADWLLDSTSLTARLKRHCQDFSVRVLGESYLALSADEQSQLATADSEGFVREVILFCDDKPWVFARTVVPLATLSQGQELQQLGERPLGALLFATPGMVRDAVEVTHLAADHPLSKSALLWGADKQRDLWGRRSRFLLPAGALLVSEMFLPDCAAYVEE
ncbi:chorismate--pyruvate lyase family protein [Corallincola holothuriorum]|nr:chorismate lyase [Corallincola holothuriorum]